MAPLLPGFVPVLSPTSFHGKQLKNPSVTTLSSFPSRFENNTVTAIAAKPRASEPDKSRSLKPSKNEGLKVASNQLRFPLNDELQTSAPSISPDAVQIMKFHGSYQQVDREKRLPNKGRAYQFMLRLKMPGGDFPASLYRVIDDIATKHGNDTLRATTRCAWQIHGILKSDLKPVFSAIMNGGGSCTGACGDLSRNVMCTPAPFVDYLYAHARWVSRMIGELFAPQSGAFSEIWLDGEKAASLEFWKSDLDMKTVREVMTFDNGNGVVFQGKEEPIYGETYLPRKFKIAVTVPGDNSVDLYTQDIGVVCIPDESGQIMGYNLIVGGGLGRTHRKEATFARTGDHLGYVAAPKLWEALKAIVATQRDHGNRSVRANARMKYLVDKLGINSFRALVETYFGERFEQYKELPEWKYEDWLGWHDQGDGQLFLGLFIEHGRIKDTADMKLRTALRRIIDAYGFDMVVTPNQNIILKNIAPNQKTGIEAILKEHSVQLATEYHLNRRLSMACPALPLCGLATTEAERVMPDIIERMTALFESHNIHVPVTMRMTGCPNGCARPYMAEVGFVGNGPGAYQLWLGGSPNQTRLAWAHIEKMKIDKLEEELTPMLKMYTEKSTQGEAFGDFCYRMGKTAIEEYTNANKTGTEVAAVVTKAEVKSVPKPAAAGQPIPSAEAPPTEHTPKVTVARGAPQFTVVGSQGDVVEVGKLQTVVETLDTTSETVKVPTVASGLTVDATGPASPESTTSSASSEASDLVQIKPKKAKRARTHVPRLTVSDDIMDRLKNIAALRDMSASKVADEIISAYLSGVEDEDVVDQLEE